MEEGAWGFGGAGFFAFVLVTWSLGHLLVSTCQGAPVWTMKMDTNKCPCSVGHRSILFIGRWV